MSRALLAQAHDALLWYDRRWKAQNGALKFSDEVMAAITTALAQPEPVLTMPAEDADPIETNLEQHRREAWELSVKGDDFTDFPNHQYALMFAHDYFVDGWNAAIAKYSAPPAPTGEKS